MSPFSEMQFQEHLWLLLLFFDVQMQFCFCPSQQNQHGSFDGVSAVWLSKMLLAICMWILFLLFSSHRQTWKTWLCSLHFTVKSTCTHVLFSKSSARGSMAPLPAFRSFNAETTCLLPPFFKIQSAVTDGAFPTPYARMSTGPVGPALLFFSHYQHMNKQFFSKLSKPRQTWFMLFPSPFLFPELERNRNDRSCVCFPGSFRRR
jgi:hypothetical protein